MHWRLWRILRDQTGHGELDKKPPKQLSKKASKQIKSGKDARGKRRGSAEN
jgi:hypothetical protein